VLLVNLLAALNFASVFFKIKNVWKIKTVKNVKNVTKIKNVKNVFLHLCLNWPEWAEWLVAYQVGLAVA